MRSVRFENRNASFDFELPDVIERLNHYSEQGVDEANEILKAISSSPSSAIEGTADYFSFVALDLIKAGKGHVYCKTCREKHDAGQLMSIPLGFGRSPFEVNLKREGGVIKRLFEKKQLICGSGGEAYLCPNGHELIGMITWSGLFQIPRKKGGETQC